MQGVSSSPKIDPVACVALVLSFLMPPGGLVVAAYVLMSERGREGTMLTRWMSIAALIVAAIGLALALSLWGGLLFGWGFSTTSS